MLRRSIDPRLPALLLAAALLPGGALAAPLVGDSNGSFFSGVSGCGTIYCAITANGGHGTGSRVEWGSNLPRQPLGDPNTLTARDTSFTSTVPANDLVIGALRWANPIQVFSPSSFDVTYNLVLNFSAPASGNGSVIVPLEIQGPFGADLVFGLTVGNLAGLTYTLPGVEISDLKFVLDTTNSTPGTTFNPGTGRWALPESGASTMLITADFAFSNGGGGETPIPAPGGLLILGAGLLALAGLRRRA